MDNKASIKLKGMFHWECWSAFNDDGSRYRDLRGRYGRRLKWADDFQNIVTNEGLTHILNAVLAGGTQITTWYCTLVETNTSPAAGMTYATPTYTESTAYDEATRPAYVETVTDQSCTNSASKAVFTISATKTMYGASLVGGGSAPTTKGNTAGGGTLLCYALASPSRSVVDNDVINLSYTISAADDGV